MTKTKDSARVFSIVLGVAFGVIALAILYAAFQGNTDFRSWAKVPAAPASGRKLYVPTSKPVPTKKSVPTQKPLPTARPSLKPSSPTPRP